MPQHRRWRAETKTAASIQVNESLIDKGSQVLIVEHENTHRLNRNEEHHDQSGLGVEIIPQVTPSKMLELPGLKKSSKLQKNPRLITSFSTRILQSGLPFTRASRLILFIVTSLMGLNLIAGNMDSVASTT